MDEPFEVVEKRLRLLALQIKAGAGISSWCFGLDQQLFYSTCPYEQEVLRFLRIGGCLDYICARERDHSKPLIVSDALGMLWAADYPEHSGMYGTAIVIGPVFTLSQALISVEEYLQRLRLSQSVVSSLRQILHEVPVIPMEFFRQYISMLHATITLEPIAVADIDYQEETIRTYTESSVHVDYNQAQEEMLLKDIQNGVVPKEVNNIIELGQTDMDLREAKNVVQVHNSLCCRAAISGGLPVTAARQQELDFRRQIERMMTVSSLAGLSKKIRRTWANKVQAIKAKTELSSPIKAVCEYIATHIREDISLQELARTVGYTDYYLTKKFQSEMGVRLTDYIKNKRVEYAKILLATSDRTIDEICEIMSFSSRSYFSRIFSQIAGITPSAYRESVQHRVSGKETP